MIIINKLKHVSCTYYEFAIWGGGGNSILSGECVSDKEREWERVRERVWLARSSSTNNNFGVVGCYRIIVINLQFVVYYMRFVFMFLIWKTRKPFYNMLQLPSYILSCIAVHFKCYLYACTLYTIMLKINYECILFK